MNHFSAVWGGLQAVAIRADGEVMNHFFTALIFIRFAGRLEK
jgi:hypothetical protein